jgi:hypothetical protein
MLMEQTKWLEERLLKIEWAIKRTDLAVNQIAIDLDEEREKTRKGES